jgi:hypothetical protein
MVRASVARILRCVGLAAVLACGISCSSPDSGALQIVTGEETDTFSRSPAPTTLRVDATDSNGNDTVLATVALPATTVDLGTHDESLVATLGVSGLDASGKKLVFGATLPVTFGGLVGTTIPVFVQRTGELARMPGPLSDARAAPLLAVVQGQYLFLGGGSDTSLAATTQLYDFGQFAPLPSPPTLPRVPESIAFVGAVAWLINHDGATYFDFSSSTSLDIPVPAGATFADVAGGVTVTDDKGALYVVGATRVSGAATSLVLKIDPADTSNTSYPLGHPSWLSLAAARLGASAAWVPSRGLVVAGGSENAAGVEVLAPGASSSTALSYPPLPVYGAGASTLDTQHVLLAGGVDANGHDAGVSSLDLACSLSCSPATWTSLPAVLAPAQAFTLDPADAVVVGTDLPSGLTRVFRLTTASATEIPTRVPLSGARAAWSPVGSIVLAGGSNLLESLSP